MDNACIPRPRERQTSIKGLAGPCFGRPDPTSRGLGTDNLPISLRVRRGAHATHHDGKPRPWIRSRPDQNRKYRFKEKTHAANAQRDTLALETVQLNSLSRSWEGIMLPGLSSSGAGSSHCVLEETRRRLS